jgi:aminoglycoside phosphotransferase family enzyme/predicted kinase
MARATPLAPPLEAAAAQVALLGRGLWRAGRQVQLIETPHAWILLADSLAYKVGKPVAGIEPDASIDGGSTAAQRRQCEDEVRLNRRLQGAGTHEVLAIRGPADSPSFGGHGPVIGYAVAMDRVSPTSLASLRLAHGTLEPAHVARLAEFVEHFHRAAATARPGLAVRRPGEVPAGIPAALARLGAVAAPATRNLLERWLRIQAAALTDRFSRRMDSGHVRDGHGDLRLEHVAVDDDVVRVFTGVEHDPARRWIDVQGDVAGLVVDLMAHGRRDLAFVFLNRYLELSGDYAGLEVLRFHLVLRALQRAADLPPGTPTSGSGGRFGANEHLALALRLAHGADPRLLVTHGLPGAGKSYAVGLLLERAGAIRVCSAVELRRLSGQPPSPHQAHAAPPWLSRAQAQLREGVAAQMLAFERLRTVAAVSLRAGFPTIVDTDGMHRWQRSDLRELATTLQVPFTILDCQRDDVAARSADNAAPPGADDGDPLGELERRCTLTVADGQPLSPAALAASWLRAPAQRPGFRH